MAKIRSGGLLGQASGGVGNIVFSHNRGGAYIRARSVPVNTQTPFKDAVHDAVTLASSAWASLTAAERQSWESWAAANQITDRLGMQLTLQPNAAFVALNSRLAFHGQAISNSAPALPAPASLLTITPEVDLGSGDIELNFTATPAATGIAVEVMACVVTSPAVRYVTNLLRTVVLSAGAQASPLDLDPELEDRLGTLAVGQTVHMWARTFRLADGQVSGWLRGSTVVVSSV